MTDEELIGAIELRQTDAAIYDYWGEFLQMWGRDCGMASPAWPSL